MRIGKIVEDVELVRLDELTDGHAPVDEAPVDEAPAGDQPHSATGS